MQTELIGKKHLLTDIWEFKFTRPNNFRYVAGDFCELELGNKNTGAARWLTIASQPKQEYLVFITKVPTQNPSLFKNMLLNMMPGDRAMLSPALGMFHLPKRTDAKILLIALGLGITPYKSMLDWITVEKLSYDDICLLYWAKPGQHLPLTSLTRIIPVVASAVVNKITTDEYSIDLQSLNKLCDDWRQRIVYLSGPEKMCLELYKQLRESNLPLRQIKLDYFEGYSEI